MMVSVIMSVYKEPINYVKLSLESILNQSYTDLEFIIINDNPNDIEINNFICDYKDPRIQYHRNKENLGLAKSLNKAILLSKGNFIARMDADDISLSTRLQDQLDFLVKNQDIQLLGSQATLIDDYNNHIGIFRVPISSEQIKVSALYGVPFVHPSVMFRRRVFDEFHFAYNPDFTTAQDYELWSRLVHKIKCANFSKRLLYYRQSPTQLSNKNVEQQTSFFSLALKNQLQFLGIDLSHEEIELLTLMCRNKSNNKLNSKDIDRLGSLLLKIYNNDSFQNNYNTYILAKSFIVNFSLAKKYFEGKSFFFLKKQLKLISQLKIKLKHKIIFALYVFKGYAIP